MEIDNAILQDLESLGQKKFFKMAMEKLSIFLWESIRHCICCVCSIYYLKFKA